MTDTSLGSEDGSAEVPPESAPTRAIAETFPTHVYTQADFRHYLAAIGGILTAFGIVAAFAGHHFLVTGTFGDDQISADAGTAWMWTGIGALVFGMAIPIVQLFLRAYGRPDAS